VNVAYGHDPRQSFFIIHSDAESTEIHAEFPWSIRNALLDVYPNLESSGDRSAFDSMFFIYIKDNLLLYDDQDNLIPLSVIRKLPETGHSHQADYLLIYTDGQPFRIENTIMFNLYADQKNFHSGEVYDIPLNFITTSSQPVYQIVPVAEGSNMFMIIVFAVFVTGLMAMVWRYYRMR
jgi:hypothetical protein